MILWVRPNISRVCNIIKLMDAFLGRSWARQFAEILAGVVYTLPDAPTGWLDAEVKVAARFGGALSTDRYGSFDITLPGGVDGLGVFIDVKFGDTWGWSEAEVDQCKFFVLVSSTGTVTLQDLRGKQTKEQFKLDNNSRLRTGGYNTVGSVEARNYKRWTDSR